GGLVNRESYVSKTGELATANTRAASPIAAAEFRQAMAVNKGYVIAGPISSREILEKTIPTYPAWAQDKALQGVVSIYILVNPDGTVNSQIRTTRTTGYPDLDHVAVEAVKKWKFSPAPQNSWGIITFQFTPKK